MRIDGCNSWDLQPKMADSDGMISPAESSGKDPSDEED
jgi:hypothetical protein